MRYLILSLIGFWLIVPLSLYAQYDFNSDGVDEVLHVSEDESGLIRWDVLDLTTGENSTLGFFGNPRDQLAVGNWITPDRPVIGVITNGSNGDSTYEDNRFRLVVPLDIVNSAESLIINLQRGKRASIISSADFDGNGISRMSLLYGADI